MNYIRVFTKPIVEKSYDAGLANSVHFELLTDTKTHELNCGYGILFPEGLIDSDNTIAPRGVINPFIIKDSSKDKDLYLICCDYVNEAGDITDPGKYYAWSTEDFVDFTDLGLTDKSFIAPIDGNDKIEIPGNLICPISNHWIPPYGLTVTNQRTFNYPLVKGFADPVFFSWKGKWYFLATNDINGNVGIFMREADNIEGLFSKDYRLNIILEYNEDDEFIQTFWAPEWHIIGGTPYILFAVGGYKWAPQSHMMKYKGTGSIMDPDSWEKPVRVRKKDGSFLSEDGITLDMTYLPTPRADYVIWSERYNIGTPLDSGSMLYIATVDSKNPCILTSDKVLLSRPLYGWENVAGTINNEGPYCLIRNGKVTVSYSGGDACGHYYAVGCLSADINDNLLDISNWKKSHTPFFNAYTLDGVDGPGHSSFFTDENGKDMIAFHGQDNGRQSGIHQFFLTDDGRPVIFD